MGASFNDQFDQFGHWRTAFASQLTELRQWLEQHELLDSAVQHHLQQLEARLHNDQVRVAFVAECSRGKSELINAVFFAHYGRQIISHSSGGSTLCPIELAYDPKLPACLRLLPIETRAQPYSLGLWRSQPSIWVQLPLDVDDPDQLALQMAKVSEVKQVPIDQARTLGFWSDEIPEENPVPDDDGLVTIPKWRHALVNMAHPLLRQGLVIVDMPGLNAISTGPELTVNLLTQMHACVFLLTADLGATPQDLSVWNEHLLPRQREKNALVVLNKIDALEHYPDAAERLQALHAACAQALGVDPSHIIALSARQGLEAKIAHNPELLAHSRLPVFEDTMVHSILRQRQNLLRQRTGERVLHMQAQVRRAIDILLRDLDVQQRELQALRDQPADTVQATRQRILQEQQAFAAIHQRVFELRSAHLRLMNQALRHMGPTAVRRELETLGKALTHSGLDHGIRATYALMFERLRSIGTQVHAAATEVQSLWTQAFVQLNAEFGFSLEPPPALPPSDAFRALNRLQESYLHYLDSDTGHVRKLANPLFSQRLVHALGFRLETMLDAVGQDLNLWSKGPISQLDLQLQERQQGFAQRLAAIDSIAQQADALDTHLAAIAATRQHLTTLQDKLQHRVEQLLHPTAPPVA